MRISVTAGRLRTPHPSCRKQQAVGSNPTAGSLLPSRSHGHSRLSARLPFSSTRSCSASKTYELALEPPSAIVSAAYCCTSGDMWLYTSVYSLGSHFPTPHLSPLDGCTRRITVWHMYTAEIVRTPIGQRRFAKTALKLPTMPCAESGVPMPGKGEIAPVLIRDGPQLQSSPYEVAI